MSNHLNVRNVAQQALFTLELMGQISDGNWENARPHGHWKKWCNAEVAVNPENVGRDFWAAKDNYNFCDSGLLEVVGERMLRAARRAIVFGIDRATELNGLTDLEGMISLPSADLTGDYWDKKRMQIANIDDLEYVQKVSEDKTIYSKKQMMADLKDLKMICRTNMEVLASV